MLTYIKDVNNCGSADCSETRQTYTKRQSFISGRQALVEELTCLDTLQIPGRMDEDAMSICLSRSPSLESESSGAVISRGSSTCESDFSDMTSEAPSEAPSRGPSEAPSQSQSQSQSPTQTPSRRPTQSPTLAPSPTPTRNATPAPVPTRSPTEVPTKVASPADVSRKLEEVPSFAVNSYQFFDTLEDAESKNVMIAISCNKKNKAIIDLEKAKELIKYTAGFTTGKICVFIADEVMKYNHMAGGKNERVALELGLAIGEHFEAVWKQAFAEMPSDISARGAVYRCADLYTTQHLDKFAEVKRTMEEIPELHDETWNAASQLLRWRCSKYSVKAKRVKQILNFMYNEIPTLGLWRPMVLGGIKYEAMIYPATNPRGMSVVARASANFDKVFGPSNRFLRVFHMKHENTDKESGEADVQKYFDQAFLNHNRYE